MLETVNLCVGYEDKVVIDDLSIKIAEGEMVSILGPNGSGKSTALKAISRVLKHRGGQVILDNQYIFNISQKAVAKKMSMLSQVNIAPSDLTVEKLISFGRTPHKKWYESLDKEDQEIIEWAIKVTGLSELRTRYLNEISGGERQRAWIAMSLAQKPKVLLLDEPTTFLDICHQYEVMELLKQLNKEINMTIVMVLHDLNQAMRYSDKVFVLKKGSLVAFGDPADILSPSLIEEVYSLNVKVLQDQNEGHNLIVPCGCCSSF